MAGKRQHYLPKFLLAGYSHRRTSKEAYCWVYRAGSKYYEANTKNIGVEGFFYGSADDTEVDDSITDAEAQYSNLLERLKLINVSTALTEPLLLEFIVHMSIRTRHIRETFSSAGDSLIDKLKEIISTPEKLQNFALRGIQSDPQILQEAIDNEFKKRGLDGLLDEDAKSKFMDAVHKAAPLLIKNLSYNDSHKMMQVIEQSKEIIPRAAKAGHLKALRRGLAPEKRMEQLSHLEWEISIFPSNTLVLGDVGAWAICEGDNQPVPLAWSGHGVTTVVLPISHTHAIVGKSSLSPTTFDALQMNATSVALSNEYYVASTAEQESLSTLIGSMAMNALDDKVAEAIENINEE